MLLIHQEKGFFFPNILITYVRPVAGNRWPIITASTVPRWAEKHLRLLSKLGLRQNLYLLCVEDATKCISVRSGQRVAIAFIKPRLREMSLVKETNFSLPVKKRVYFNHKIFNQAVIKESINTKKWCVCRPINSTQFRWCVLASDGWELRFPICWKLLLMQ